MAKYRYVQDGNEFYLEDQDNPGVIISGPVTGNVDIHNQVTGTTFSNYKTAEEIAEENQ